MRASLPWPSLRTALSAALAPPLDSECPEGSKGFGKPGAVPGWGRARGRSARLSVWCPWRAYARASPSWPSLRTAVRLRPALLSVVKSPEGSGGLGRLDAGAGWGRVRSIRSSVWWPCAHDDAPSPSLRTPVRLRPALLSVVESPEGSGGLGKALAGPGSPVFADLVFAFLGSLHGGVSSGQQIFAVCIVADQWGLRC